jgi:hypothetical protein
MEEMTAIEMTKQAMMVQDKTQESTSRAKKALEETIQVLLNNADWSSNFQCVESTGRETEGG